MQSTSTNLAMNLRRRFTEGWPSPLTPSNFQRSAQNTTTVTENTRLNEDKNSFFWKKLETSLISMIYGSNYIESAGTGLNATASICRAVFNGEENINLKIDASDSSYQEHLDHLQATSRKPTDENIVQSRREVLSHAKALSHMVSQVVVHDIPWSEDLILETHKILHQDLEDKDSHVVPGQYRTHEVAISYTNPETTKRKVTRCMRASAVPSYMTALLSNLTHELSQSGRSLDPYVLAARYAHHFVMIHPFSDGNGRMSRVILNTLLLQFAGQVAVLGVGAEEKRTYLDVVGQGGKMYRREDMEVGFWEQESHLEFSSFVRERVEGGLCHDECFR